MNAPEAAQQATAAQAAPRTLGTGGLLILSIGTFTLSVDGFVLSGCCRRSPRPCTSR